MVGEGGNWFFTKPAGTAKKEPEEIIQFSFISLLAIIVAGCAFVV